MPDGPLLNANDEKQPRFRRIQLLATGRGATSSRAFDRQTRQTVTLIQFHPDQIIDPSIEQSFAARFSRETGVLAAIDHPNVARVVAAGEAGGQPYLAIAAPPGQTLAEVIATRGALPVGESVAIVRQIVAGLDALHAAGVLHLRLTPGAVLLGDDGIARLTEVGIAATGALDELADRAASDPVVRFDRERYQAPELIESGEVSEATDLYAAGALLYELLTGQAPFPGNNSVLMRFAKFQSAPPVPSRLVGGTIPAVLDSVVARALAIDPIDRFADARAMLDALNLNPWQLAATAESAAPITTPRPVRPAHVDVPPPRPARPSMPVNSWSSASAPDARTIAVPAVSVPPSRLTSVTSGYAERPVRRRARGSGWVVPMILAGLVIAVLVAGLIRNLTGDEPLEAVAGVSTVESIAKTPTAEKSRKSTPTPRVVNGNDDQTDATKTPKPKKTKTPKPDDDAT